MQEQEGREDRKTKILKAALEAYARHGIHNATARQIAEIAGIGKSTIFEYFKSCESLMNEAFAWYIGQQQAAWENLRQAAETDAAAALAAYFDSLTELILREPGKLLLLSQYVTAILASGLDFAEVKREYRAKLQPSADALLSQFRHVVSCGVRSGAFRPAGGLDEQDCALMIMAVAREMQSQAFAQEETQVRETCARLKRTAFRMLGSELTME